MNNKREKYAEAIGILFKPDFSSKQVAIVLAQTYPSVLCEVYSKCKNEVVVAPVAPVASVAPVVASPVSVASVAPVATPIAKKKMGRPVGALGKKTIAKLAIQAQSRNVIDVAHTEIVSTPVAVAPKKKAVRALVRIHYTAKERDFIISARAGGMSSPEIATTCNKLFHKNKPVRTTGAIYSRVTKHNTTGN